MNSINKRNDSWTLRRIRIAYIFFFIATLYGFMMRWQKFSPVFSYKFNHVLQAHSHTTFLGWGVLSVITLISFVFLKKEAYTKAVYSYPFAWMSMSLVGMLISFPIQGYKLFSIVFLSVFLFSSYVFLWGLYRSLKNNATLSARYIRSGIVFYYLSSLGIWGLSFITVKFGKGDLYRHAISFYTHFLYNGFFVMVLWGLFLKVQARALEPYDALLKRVLPWMNCAILLSFALSLLWKPMPWYVQVLGGIGAVIQVVVAYVFIQTLVKNKRLYQKMSALENYLWQFIFYAYVLKVLLQLLSAYAPVTQIALKYKSYFVIGYIHLFTLAFMSLFILLLTSLILKVKLHKTSIRLLIAGIIGSEFLLFFQGILLFFNKKIIRHYDVLMWMISSLMIIGIGWILWNIFKKSDYLKVV